MSFSQRKGIVQVNDFIQTNGMDDRLRNSLWNCLDVSIWSVEYFVSRQVGAPGIDAFSHALWFHHFKKPIDSRPRFGYEKLKAIRTHFFGCAWNEVYDFLEFVIAFYPNQVRLPEMVNSILARESSAYRIVSSQVVDITSEQETRMLEEAIQDTKFAGSAAHLLRALELLADRERPDYRNSIKESVSAVESIARIVAENPKATLSDALKALERNGKVHSALKDGFIKLYGYTSDEQGIRHAMLDEPEITAADAKYFLLSCTSFANYLKSQMPSG